LAWQNDTPASRCAILAQALPDNWILGQVAGIAVDRNDHIWIIHRPLTLVDDEKEAMKDRPPPLLQGGAPVMEFDADGNLLRIGAVPVPAMNGRRTNMASSLTATAMSGSPATTTPTIKS